MKIYIITYDIRNGGSGPSLFKTKKAALKHVREDFKDEKDFSESNLKELMVDGFTHFGWDDENSISLHHEKVIE